MSSGAEKVNNLSSEQAAYIAGIVDGEGTITLTRRNIYRHRYLALTISSCEPSLLEYVMKIVGAGNITTKRVYSEKHSPSYTYQIFSRQALGLIDTILPYLHTYKKKRAQLVLANYLKFTPRNGKYTPLLIKQRQNFIEKFFAITTENAKTRRGGSVRK